MSLQNAERRSVGVSAALRCATVMRVNDGVPFAWARSNRAWTAAVRSSDGPITWLSRSNVGTGAWRPV